MLERYAIPVMKSSTTARSPLSTTVLPLVNMSTCRVPVCPCAAPGNGVVIKGLTPG